MSSPPQSVLQFPAMATLFTLHLEEPDEARARDCAQAARAEVERVEQIFSRFRPGSELARINRLAAQAPVVTDPEVFQMLAVALEVSRRTGASFDPTIGPLSRAWRAAAASATLPAALQQASHAVGWQHVQLNPAERSVYFERPGMELDLGAMAKGYAVDRALDVLQTCAVEGLVDAGSSSMAATPGCSHELRAVFLGHPLRAEKTIGAVTLQGLALATSGVREQSFAHNGQRYSHLLDPARPDAPGSVLQCTVLCPSATVADALSTALFVLGPERGSQAAHGFDDCAALWMVEADGLLHVTGYDWPVELPASSAL